jgi:hypothetical protein
MMSEQERHVPRHVVFESGPFTHVRDARLDPRFAANP